MKILVLGGTVFLGRALVEAALARAHEVTLFNRGQHNPELFPQVEKVRGDRDPAAGSGLAALQGRRWDAVIDPSGYVPRVVGASAEALRDSVEHYTFISSISVYRDFKIANADESYPVGTLADESVEQISGETYGPLKALCERTVSGLYGERALNIRPGLIVGPHDPTDRFTYWPVRVARGGETLAPGRPDMPVQIIDVRDLAEWTIRMVEQRRAGIYNATGPDYTLTMYKVLHTSKDVSRSAARFTWISESFLLTHDVKAWSEVPLWIPRKDNEGFHTSNIDKAIAADLTFRPLAETIRDTLDWHETRPTDYEWRNGLKADKEQALLAAWHADAP